MSMVKANRVPCIPGRPRTKPGDPLTHKQAMVFSMILAGLMEKQIADRMNISIKTVEGHMAAVRVKMNAFTTKQAIGNYYQQIIVGLQARIDELETDRAAREGHQLPADGNGQAAERRQESAMAP